MACEAKQDCVGYFYAWAVDRIKFVAAWEKNKSDCFKRVVCHAVRLGDIAIWRLLNGFAKRRFRLLVLGDSNILTGSVLISKQLSSFHERSMIENTSITPVGFEPAVWAKDFLMKEGLDGDIVLNISHGLC